MNEHEPEWRIVEGVSGTWHYHLRDHNWYQPQAQPAACGAKVMSTSIPLASWGKTPKDYHLPQKWCDTCAKKAGLAT